MTYRDPFAGLRGQIVVKRAAALAKRDLVSPGLRALLDDRRLSELADLEARCARHGVTDDEALARASVEALSAADAELDALAAAYEEAMALGERLRDCAETPHDPPAPEIPAPWIDEDPAQLALRRAVEARVLSLDEDSFLRRWGDYGYLSRLGLEDVRLVLHFALELTAISFTIEGFHASLRATIPKSFRPLHLRPEKTADAVKKAVGLAHELSIGDEVLDQAYFVTGDRRSLPILGVPRVRDALRELVPHAAALHAEAGTVVVTWSGKDDLSAALGAFAPRLAERVFPSAAIDLVLGVKKALVDE